MIKRRFGPWMLKAFGALAPLKFLRGTAFDVFGYSTERRMERGLIAAFEQDLALAVERSSADNFNDIKALLALPMDIRGYGHVKHANMEKSKVQHSQLMAKIMEPRPVLAVAAE
jgi:indolepyruvate ferredoxin oxidoreductase